MTQNVIKIGVLGTSNIAGRSLIQPARNNSKCEVFGIASRDIVKAKNYADLHGISNYFPDYSSLVESKEIDAVYIPLINSLHSEWIIKSAEAGKHILVEKPICISKDEIGDIRFAVNKNKVCILEAVMVQHHQFIAKLKEMFESNEFGRLISMHTHMSVPQNTHENYRFDPAKGGGVFYDMAPYWLFLVQRILGMDIKTFDGNSAFHGPNNSDLNFEANLILNSGVECSFKCSFEEALKADYIFEFKSATVTVKNFLRPAIGNNILAISIDYKNSGKEIKKIKFDPQNYYDNQLEFFLQTIHGKQANIPIEESFERIEIIEKIFNSAKEKRI